MNEHVTTPSERTPTVTPEQRLERQRRYWQDEIIVNREFGMEFTEWSSDAVTARVPLTDRVVSGKNTMHGGVVATLVDSVANAAVMVDPARDDGSYPSTVSLTVNYLAPVTGAVVARAVATRRGRRVQFVEVDVRTDDGELVAQGLVSLTVKRSPPA